jgi:hypothetical protein
MTIEQLKELAEAILTLGVDLLKERRGDLPAMFHLVKLDGSHEIIEIEGDLINRSDVKETLARRIRERVAAGELQAVALLSDTFVGRMTEENEKIRRRLGLNVEQSAALGLCERREAVMVALDSPTFRQVITQFYKREDGRIELSERKMMDDTVPGNHGSGRMLDFFDHKGTEHRA